MMLSRCFTYLLFLTLLVACGSGEPTADGPAIAASVTEGAAPLNVKFTAQNMDEAQSAWDFGDGSEPARGSEVEHTFVEAGAHTVNFSGVDAKGNEFAASEEILVHASVNLVVSNFAIPETIVPGQDNTISATVENIGSETLDTSGVLHVGYYLSTDDEITVDDMRIGDTSIVLGSGGAAAGQHGIETLGPQQAYTYNHQLHMKGNIPQGTYFAGAIVDYIDDFDWYSFPTATDTQEYAFPVFITVPESDDTDNVSLALRTETETTTQTSCTDDGYEDDDTYTEATPLAVNETQEHNLCFDNADWYRFEGVEGTVYQITTTPDVTDGVEADTQMILYDEDGESIILFHENGVTTDLTEDPLLYDFYETGQPAEIVWRATRNGPYYVKVRTATCDEDIVPYCEPNAQVSENPPDGVGAQTAYRVTLQ